MSSKAFPMILAAVALTACGVLGGPPGKSEVQKALNDLAKETPIVFGSDTPVVKAAKCTKAGTDMYDCTVQMAMSSAPNDTTNQNIRLTKMNGKWVATMNILGGLGG